MMPAIAKERVWSVRNALVVSCPMTAERLRRKMPGWHVLAPFAATMGHSFDLIVVAMSVHDEKTLDWLRHLRIRLNPGGEMIHTGRPAEDGFPSA